MKLKKGDKVLVIAGKNRNQVGVIERVLTRRLKVVVTGLNMVKKSIKKSASNPQGGQIDKAMPIAISNVMILDPVKDKPTRVGYDFKGGQKRRVSKLTNNEIVVKDDKN